MQGRGSGLMQGKGRAWVNAREGAGGGVPGAGEEEAGELGGGRN